MVEGDKNQFSKILSGIGRYILGLFILVSPLGILILRGKPINYIFLALLTPPINLIFFPPMAIGLYFMLTGKSRSRLDITLILITIFLLYTMFSI